MTGDTLGLLARLLLSFGVVLALLWLAARVVRGQLSGRAGEAVEVLARQQLGRGAAVTVLRVADRALVLGITEHAVSLLTETSLEDFTTHTDAVSADGVGDVELDTEFAVVSMPRQRGRSSGRRHHVGQVPAGALGGSILSPQTWRRSIDVLRDRTTRR